jgi:hypothetical protein
MNATIDFPLEQDSICEAPADYAISRLHVVAKEHPNPLKSEDCVAFSRQVCTVEGIIEAIFAVTISTVRKSNDLDKILKAWEMLNGLCHRALVALSSLKDQFSGCGTPETHDRILDLKSEVLAKIERIEEERECLQTLSLR